MINPYVNNIEQETLSNDNFRTEIFTGEHMQLTVMSIPVGGDIGMETHPHTDQFLRVEQGSGKAILAGVEHEVADNFAIIIPAGTEHNVINTGDIPMKLYSIYTPPNHPKGTIDKTQADAMAREEAEGHH